MALTNEPTPRRVLRTPRRSSSPYTRATVFALTRRSTASCLTVGSRSPGRSAPATVYDIRKALLSAPGVADVDRSLAVSASPHDWLAERRFALDEGTSTNRG